MEHQKVRKGPSTKMIDRPKIAIEQLFRTG